MTGLVMQPGSEKSDTGPGHIANHVGKDAEYHGDASTPLARAEAKYDEDKLLKDVSAHCDAITARLDACEEMVRNGKQDKDD